MKHEPGAGLAVGKMALTLYPVGSLIAKFNSGKLVRLVEYKGPLDFAKLGSMRIINSDKLPLWLVDAVDTPFDLSNCSTAPDCHRMKVFLVASKHLIPLGDPPSEADELTERLRAITAKYPSLAGALRGSAA